MDTTPTDRPAVIRRPKRGPALLVSLADLRRDGKPFCSTADVLEIFREAQRVGR